MRTLMVKVNDRYIPPYRTITQILEDAEGGRVSVKKPLGEQARAHVRQMGEASQALQGAFDGLDVLPCRMQGDQAVFPFLPGRTMLAQMAEGAREGKAAFLSLWDAYVKAIRPSEANACAFRTTPEFERFFGDGAQWEGLDAYGVCSLDMLPSNIMVEPDGKRTLFDYEWLMRVPVPVCIALYHAAYFFVRRRGEFAPIVTMQELLARAGVTQDEGALEEAVAGHFYRIISREGPNEPAVEEVYDRYRKPAHDPAFFESEYYRLLTQLHEEEKERLSITDGWNAEHAHALEIDAERKRLIAERERLLAREDRLHMMLHEGNMTRYDLIGRLCFAQQQHAQTLRELETMRGSTSWRMTACLRRAGAFARRLLRLG